MDAISVHVISSEETILDCMAEAVNLPTDFGSIGVLRGHAPMLCNLEPGLLRCRNSRGVIRVRIGPGIASVENNEVNVLVSYGKVLES